MKNETDINPIDLQVGLNLKIIRTQRSMPREKLGSLLPDEISGQAIERYENGKNRISASTLVALTRILNCRLADLFIGVDMVLRQHEGKGVEVFDQYNRKILRKVITSTAVQAAMKNLTEAITKELASKFTGSTPHA